MEHQQPEKIFAGYHSGLITLGFGINISEGDHSLIAFQDIFLLNNAFVEVSAEVDQSFIAIANVFAVNDPFLRAISWDLQPVIDDCFEQFRPEDFCKIFMIENVF